MSSRVVHYRDRQQVHDLAYVGRAVPRLGLPESPFANRYRIGQDGSRFDVIQKYRSWILGQPELLQRLHELRGRPLACWCAPEPCHADVLVELVDADAVLDELYASSVNVEARQGRLHLRPASSVDETLLARVKASKPAILDLLSSRRRRPADVAEDCWQLVEAVAESLRLPAGVLEAVPSRVAVCDPLRHEPEAAGVDGRGWTRYVCGKCGRFYGYTPHPPAALRPTLETT